MKRREHPREIPDLPHYWRITLSINGEHTFRIPSQLGCMEVSRKIAKLQEKEDPAEIAFRNLAQAGAMAGDMWCHPDFDLETDRRAARDDLTYGRQVHEELHEAGYSALDINQVLKGLSDRVRASVVGEEDVKKRADFSEDAEDTGT